MSRISIFCDSKRRSIRESKLQFLSFTPGFNQGFAKLETERTPFKRFSI
jgi:hypothetical protein